MKKEITLTLQKSFEDYAHQEEGVEFWFVCVRDLQSLLCYTR